MIKDCICRQCGAGFRGGSRAWYCPSCRAKRQSGYRHKNGRHIGDTDYCVSCGKPYTIMGGLQKYCPDCAPIMIKAKDAAQGLQYYYKNKDEINDKRNKKRRKEEKFCAVCGKNINPNSPQKACGTECKSVLIKKSMEKSEYKRCHQTKFCIRCGKEFIGGRTAKYCHDCRKYPEKICEICGEKFIAGAAKKICDKCKSPHLS